MGYSSYECRCNAHRDGQSTKQAVYLAVQVVLRKSDLKKAGCRALEGELSAQLCTIDCRHGRLALHFAACVFRHKKLAVGVKYLPLT